MVDNYFLKTFPQVITHRNVSYYYFDYSKKASGACKFMVMTILTHVQNKHP